MSRTLVLIDDDDDWRELFAEYLRLDGFGVETFDRAEDAMDAVLRLRPAAVLTDVTLAGMSGADAAERLRSDARTRGIPVVAVTGRQSQELGDASSLFDAVVVKPVDAEKLVATVRALVARGTPTP